MGGQGDTIAQTILVDREKGALQLETEYRDRLYLVAISLCHDAAEADDLVLRTMERVIDRIETYEERDSFYDWMCVILQNLYRDSHRSKIVQGTIPVGGPDEMEKLAPPMDAAAIVEAVDADIARRALEKIPPKMREVLILHYFMDMPVKQIARTLMVSPGTVMSRLHYARLALAQRLGAKLKKPAVALIAAGLLLLGATAAMVMGVVVNAPDSVDVDGSGETILPPPDNRQPTIGYQLSLADSQPPSISCQLESTQEECETMKAQPYRQMMSAALMTAATTLSAAVASAEPLGSGLAAYLTFDDAVVTNRIPNSTITNITLSASGIESGVKSGEFGHSGFGGYLDVNQGWVRLDGSQNLTFENGNDFTICIWMRIEGAQTGDPVFVGNGNWGTTSRPGVLLATASNSSGWVSSLNYSVNGTSRVRVNSNDASMNIQMGKWTFYAISHTADDKFRYFMSSSSGTLATISELDAPDFKMLFDDPAARMPFHLGQDGTGTYSRKFVGKLDEFALWTRGLSPSDINAIYQNGRRGHLLDDLLKPEITVTDVGNGNIDLSFAGTRSEAYKLYVGSGAADGGTDRFAWDHFDYVTNIAPTASTYTFALPEAIKNEGRYYRFFLTKDPNYQEIEYIQNTESYAKAYCHTGVNPTKDTIVVGEVEVVNGYGYNEIFGACDTDNKLFYHLAFFYNEMKWDTEILKLPAAGGSTIKFGSGTTGVRYAFNYGVTSVSCWESLQGTASMTQALLTDRASFPDMSNPIAVFRCEKVNGTQYDSSFQGKMYSFAISTNGTVACDYIPAKNASGVAGFYDVATKTFISSETEVAFTGGAANVGRLTVQSATAKAATASDPVTAYWVGGANGAIDDPESWHCENSYGDAIETVPSLLTDVSIANAGQMFSAPANSEFLCKSIAISASISLTGDCDWRGIDLAKVTGAGSIDLAGHKLYFASFASIGNAISVTDLTGGGELHVEVPFGSIVENTGLALAGAVTLVKDGDGTLTVNRPSQSNTGGVYVNAGTLKTTAFINTGILGASGAKVKVGSCGTLQIESGYTGLENYDLELAGGVLYFYNNRALAGRTTIGSMTLSANSTLKLETVVGIGNDATCDAQTASGTVWNLGGYALTVLLETAPTDFFVGRDNAVKPIFRNGTIILLSQDGFWQDYGSDASDHVCYRYGMKNTRQRADSSTYDFVNTISAWANFSNDGTMSVYGTYTPSETNLCFKIRMMNGSTINLGNRTTAMTTALDGPSNGSLRAMTFESGATINIDFGSRKVSNEEKVVSWSAIPAGITFVDPSRRWSLVVKEDGLYAVRGFKLIIR